MFNFIFYFGEYSGSGCGKLVVYFLVLSFKIPEIVDLPVSPRRLLHKGDFQLIQNFFGFFCAVIVKYCGLYSLILFRHIQLDRIK